MPTPVQAARLLFLATTPAIVTPPQLQQQVVDVSLTLNVVASHQFELAQPVERCVAELNRWLCLRRQAVWGDLSQLMDISTKIPTCVCFLRREARAEFNW